MAIEYEWGKNMMKDFFFHLMLTDNNILNKDIKNEIENQLIVLLTNVVKDEKDLVHLDFEIERGVDENDVKIVGNNIITTLWFSGLIPNDVDLTSRQNKIKIKDKIYHFDKKKKKLIIK